MTGTVDAAIIEITEVASGAAIQAVMAAIASAEDRGQFLRLKHYCPKGPRGVYRKTKRKDKQTTKEILF